MCDAMADRSSDSGSGSGSGSGDNQGFPYAIEPGSRNKRKVFYAPISIHPSTLTEFPRYKSSSPSGKSENSPSDPLSSELGSKCPKENPKSKAILLADWNDPIVSQLEKLLTSNLHAIFRDSIKKIAAFGYSEEVAEKAVSRSGLYSGKKDPVPSIVDDTLTFLKEGKEINTSRYNKFEDLWSLVEYTMLEMIYVLREVKPSLTVVEAMWSLLLSDMNISQACLLEGDLLSSLNSKEILGESSSSSTTLPHLKSEAQSSETIQPNPEKPSLPDTQNSCSETPTFGWMPKLTDPKNPFELEGQTPENESPVSVSDSAEKSLGNTSERVQTMSTQASASKEKSGGARKGRSGKSKKEMKLQQKSSNVKKNYCTLGPEEFLKNAKELNDHAGVLLDKKLKNPPGSSGVNTKKTSSNINTAVEADAPLPDGGNHLSSNAPVSPVKDLPATLPTEATASALPAANSEPSTSLPPEKKTTPMPEASIQKPHKTPNYYAGIPYDKALGKYIPQDAKDEMLLKLVPRLQELQNELQGWTDWANRKVMQVACRLSKDQAELKALRQEKEAAEQLKKEKQTLEDNTMKRLSEMESALGNAAGQVDKANYTARMLEMENSKLKKDWEEAKLLSAQSAAKCRLANESMQDTLKKVQSQEGQKGLLQEELANEKLKLTELQRQVGKARDLHSQTEANWKQERMAREKLLMQAASIRKERERIEALGKEKEDKLKQKAENDKQKYVEDIKKLEDKASELRLKSESSKIAALRRGIDASYGSSSKSAPDLKKGAPKRLPVFRELEAKGLREERECVMCLSEEKSVIFLPCAHQVVCTKCNELHEKQGMKECPTCRTPIQVRFAARFIRS